MGFNFKSIKQRKYLEAQAKINDEMQDLFAYDPKLKEESGIYILTRADSKRHCVYVGQAKNVLRRLAEHIIGYMPVDMSIRKHGLKYPSSPYGWRIDVEYCANDKKVLDERERFWINDFQNRDDVVWEVYNITSGGQGEGKVDINERKAARGYQDGLKQGEINAYREVLDILKYLDFLPKDDFAINDKKVIEIEEWINEKKAKLSSKS